MDRAATAAAAAALLAALWIAMLAAGGPDSASDKALLAALNREALVPAARTLTRLGDGVVLLALGAAATAALALHGRRRDALLFAVVVLSCRLAVELQKLGFDRARPDPAGHGVAVHSMAFPSAHAANSMATFLALALIAAPPGRRVLAAAGAVLLSILVGLTRPALAVHWPSDVIGGWAFGAGWTLILLRLAGGTSPRPPH